MEDNEPFPPLFRLARRVSKLSDFRIKVGCVISRNRTVISIGHNKTKYNKLWCHPLKKLHAEAVALKLAGRDDLSGCTVYVYRESKNGTPRMSKPCEDCEKLLRERKVKRVVYSTSEFPYFETMYF